MITIGELKRLVDNIPDDARAFLFDGEVKGLVIDHGNVQAFIDVGGPDWAANPGYNHNIEKLVLVHDINKMSEIPKIDFVNRYGIDPIISEER